ncbi:hypothetical protein GCM10025868_12140 [Angustibacter aerolatus]|uniref:ABC transporter domain-containing protein n=1 Tax=Angustibacter aerolatus TaxID=1162965 RepID=A0ABQ6JDT2_9ACTN|nr:ATP-binding cassette domain-containing protein [Angustibacter aerolatus]GMA85964.1 hypothetical protein GCM10025868_12140 [Angustibacter aerolatus]
MSVDVARGEFVFVVGASGSGKSTMLRLVLKEEKATSGTVHVAGRDVAKAVEPGRCRRLRRQIGAVFQDFRLLPNKTVTQNVAFALQVIGKPRHTIAQVVPETLEARRPGGQGRPAAARACRVASSSASRSRGPS